MKSSVIFTMLFTLPVIATADPQGGVEDSNYQVTISGTSSDYGNTARLSGGARFPVADNTGMSLSAGLTEFNGKNSFADSSSRLVGLGIFFRKYDLGIINAGYSYSESETDLVSGTKKNNFDTYSLNGTYYIDMFDISLYRSTATDTTGSSFNSSRISAAYYANDNLRISASAGGMDSDESYTFGVLYQPETFNNAIGISATYQEDKTYDSYNVSITYHFDTKVSLIDRIRRY